MRTLLIHNARTEDAGVPEMDLWGTWSAVTLLLVAACWC